MATLVSVGRDTVRYHVVTTRVNEITKKYLEKIAANKRISKSDLVNAFIIKGIEGEEDGKDS